MIVVKLYSRPGCHLCEQALADFEALRGLIPHKVEVVDIESDPELLNTYLVEIPVVEIGPYKLKAPFTRQELQVTLSAARDRDLHITRVENSQALTAMRETGTWNGADRFSYWLSRHYLLLLNLMVFIYVGLSFLAPVLAKAGAETPANLLYKAYSVVCHQLAYRSFFLFGEQSVYPRAAAGVDVPLTFQQATGLSGGDEAADLFAARAYIGDERVGYKVALCERDAAIYAAILLFGLLFGATGRRLPALPWYLWLVLAIVPIGLDGFSQLFSQPPLSFIPYRESTPFLRVLTGGLFGFMTAWFGYPLVEESMVDTREFMAAKWARVQKHLEKGRAGAA